MAARSGGKAVSVGRSLAAFGMGLLVVAGVHRTSASSSPPVRPGPAAARTLHLVQDASTRLGTTHEVALPKLGTTFVLKQPGLLRVYSQVSHSRPDTGTWVVRTTRLKLNGKTIAAATTQGSGGEYPTTLYRVLRLAPGSYSLSVTVTASWGESQVLGTAGDTELTYLDAELE
jgi:hypothetical protein